MQSESEHHTHFYDLNISFWIQCECAESVSDDLIMKEPLPLHPKRVAVLYETATRYAKRRLRGMVHNLRCCDQWPVGDCRF